MRSSRLFVFSLTTLFLAVAVAAAQPPGRGGRGGPGGFGGRGRPDPEQAALDRLRLSDSQEEKAQRVLDSQQRTTGRMLDDTRRDFLKQMEAILTTDQMLEVKDSLNARPGRGRPVSVDDMVDRIMAHDKNKTGKVSKEDLPERMQHLIALGDANKDGYLDRDEVKQLAIKLSQQGRGGRNQVPDFDPGDADRALNRLTLNTEQKEKSKAPVDTFRQAFRKVTDERREDLVLRMKDVLSEEQLKQFKDALLNGGRGRRGPG